MVKIEFLIISFLLFILFLRYLIEDVKHYKEYGLDFKYASTFRNFFATFSALLFSILCILKYFNLI